MQCTWEVVLTPDEARLKWEAWEKDKSSCPWLNTMHGDVWKVRVPKSIGMDFVNRNFRRNSIEAKVKTLKKPTGEQLAAASARLGNNMDMFGSAENMLDFSALGHGVLKAGGPRGAEGIGVTIGDVSDLVQPGNQEEEQDEEEDEEDDDADKDGEPKKKKTKKVHTASPKDKWFNKAAFHVDKEEAANAMIETVQKDLVEVKDKLKKLVEETQTCVI